MDKPQVFVDTSFFKTLVDPKDDFHGDALKVINSLQNEKVALVTSNYILDESFTLIKIRCGRELVNQFRKDLAESSLVLKLIRVTVKDEAKAWEWFLLDWSDLSFTDCVSFALMKRLDITRVAAFDQDFERAGFKIEG